MAWRPSGRAVKARTWRRVEEEELPPPPAEDDWVDNQPATENIDEEPTREEAPQDEPEAAPQDEEVVDGDHAEDDVPAEEEPPEERTNAKVRIPESRRSKLPPLAPRDSDADRGAAPDVEEEHEEQEEEEGEMTEADKTFIDKVEDLINNSEARFNEIRYVAIPDVANILEFRRNPAEMELRLQTYIDMQSDADGCMEDYVELHYADFNASIQFLSDMAISVCTAQDTIASLKKGIGVCTAGLQSHATEVVALKRRLLKNVYMREILQDVLTCARAERDLRSLIDQKHYLLAVKKLIFYRDLLSTPELCDLRALLPVATYILTTQNTLHTTIAKDLMDSAFKRQALEDPSRGLSAAVLSYLQGATSDGDVFRVERRRMNASDRLISALLDPELNIDESDFGTYLLTPIDWTTQVDVFIPICVVALNRLGKLDEGRAALFNKSSPSIQQYITKFLAMYTEWAAAQTIAGRGHASTIGTIVSRSFAARDGKGAEQVVAEQQSQNLRSVVGSLLRQLLKMMRNVVYVTSVVVALKFPFLREFLDAPASFSEPLEWKIHDVPMEEEDIKNVMAEAEAISKVGNPPEVQDAMMTLWTFVDRKLVAVMQPPTLRKLREHLERAADFARKSKEGSSQYFVMALDISRTQLDGIARRTFQEQVSALLRQWDARIFWSHVNLNIEVLLRELCNTRAHLSDTELSRAVANIIMQKTENVREAQSIENKNKTLADFIHQRQAAQSTLPAYVCSEPLETLLQRKGPRKLPRFIDDIGTVAFSLSASSAVTLADASAEEASAASVVASAVTKLNKYFLFSIYNLAAIAAILQRFVRTCEGQLLVPSSANRPRKSSVEACIEALTQRVLVPNLGTSLATDLQTFLMSKGEDGGRSYDASVHHPTTPLPVLESAVFIFDAIRNLMQLAESFPNQSSAFLVSTASLMDAYVSWAKQRIDQLAHDTFAFRYVGPLLNSAFLFRESSEWQVLTDEDNLFGTHVFVDKQLFAWYRGSSEHRTRAGAPEIGEPSSTLGFATELDDMFSIPPNQLRLSTMTDISQLALLCHSLEWLAENYIAMTNKVDSLSRQSVVPGQKLLAELLKKQDEAKAIDDEVKLDAQARVLVSFKQAVIVAQAALFILSVDTRFVAFCFLPQMRDEPYNTTVAGPYAESFVEEFNRTLTRRFACFMAHLYETKRKYIALSLTRPIAELFLNELAFLRNKVITTAGVEQMKINVLAVQKTCQLLLPLDNDVRDAVSDYLSKTRVYYALLDNHNVVSEIFTQGLHTRFTQLELENLISLVFRQETDAMFENIVAFRQKLKLLQEDGGDNNDEVAADADENANDGAATSPQAQQPETAAQGTEGHEAGAASESASIEAHEEPED